MIRGLVAAAPLLAACAGEASAFPSPNSVPWTLEAGETFELSVESPGIHDYRPKLAPGDFLAVRVDQDGVDVTVVLLDGDTPLREIDTPTGNRGPEHLWWIASGKETELRIEVRANRGSGCYRISAEPPRPAGHMEALHVEAQGAYLRGERHVRSREYDEATAAYTESVRLWRSLEQPFQESLSLSELGRTAERRNGLEDALAYYRQALEIVTGLSETDQEVRLLNQSGRVYRLRGELEQAAEHYRQALELAAGTGHREGEAVAANNLAVFYILRGEAEKAITLFERARRLAHEVGNEDDEATATRGLGRAYLLLDQVTDALDTFERLLELPRQSPLARSRTLSTVGWCHFQQGDSGKALKFFEEALRVRRGESPDFSMAGILDRMGTAQAELEQWQEAESSYLEALSFFRRGGYRLAEGNTLANLCNLYDHSGRADEAMGLCRKALDIFREAGDGNAEAFALYVIARIERRIGELDSAEARMAENLDRVDRLRAAAGSESLKTSFFADRLRYYEFYVDLLMEMDQKHPDGGWAARALTVHERSRARSLLELLAESGMGIRRNTDPALLDEERWLFARIEEMEAARKDLTDAAQLAEVHRELRGLLRRLDRLRLEIRRAHPEYASLLYPEPLDARQIRGLLDSDTKLLVYALGRERSFLWYVSRSELVGFPLPSREEIERRARQFHRLISDPRRQVSAEGRREWIAQWLSDTLLGPAASRIGDSRLVVLADGALHYVPFGALPLPAAGRADPAPLLSRHEVLSLPSASALAVLRRQLEGRTPAPGLAAVVADPVFSAEDPRVRVPRVAREQDPAPGQRFKRLPQSGREARAILALASGEPTLLIEGFEANREKIESGLLAGYRILHFATHGVIDTNHPGLSGLALSQVDEEGKPRPGFLRLYEIYNLDLPAELVVASACQTAQGKQIRGEGLVGLTRAFYYAGIPRVVVSLWSVEDRAGAVLVERFYAHLLQDGLGPAAALQAAQASMWREGRWQPHYWAGFVLQGEWRGFEVRRGE